MKSIWENNSQITRFSKIIGEQKTDVLIIGGGLAGIMCAFYLKQNNIDYILVEGKTIGSGVTKNTTAKITAAHGLIYHQLIKKHGIKTAQLYLSANIEAVQEYRILAQTFTCDFKDCASYVYTLKSKQLILDESSALQKLSYLHEVVEEIPLPIKVSGAIKYYSQATFNPLMFIEEIARELNIFENSYVYSLKNNVAFTDVATITAKRIVIATHFPFINRHGMYFLKMYQHRSYVIAYKNAGSLQDSLVDECETGFSFRSYGDILLIGGGSHKTGEKGQSFKAIENFAKRCFPLAIEVNRFATQDCMTLDDIPYIGKYSLMTPNLFVMTGFNKWGMTTSLLAGKIIADLLLNRQNKYSKLYSPSRSVFTVQLLKNVATTIKNQVTFSSPRCSHLGCALKYNKQEHTFDCPCHGSRFDDCGEVVNNPAVKKLKKRKKI